MEVEWPVFKSKYRCLGCDGTFEVIEGSNATDVINEKCCTYQKALKVETVQIKNPTWDQIKVSYGAPS